MRRIMFLLSLVLCSLSMMATNDTIDLALPAYGINTVQANYYVSARGLENAQGHFKFILYNSDEDYPEMYLTVKANDSTKIQGQHEVELELSQLSVWDGAEVNLTVSKALAWFKYTGNKNIDGDPIYNILAYAKASDDMHYIFRGELPVGAFAEDVLDGEGLPTPYALADEKDDSIVEPELPEEGPTTAIDNISADSAAQKIFIDGQIYILRGEKVYTLQGQEVR